MADDVKTPEQKRAEAQARVAEANKPKEEQAKPAQTRSANKSMSVKETVSARADAFSTNRWAKLIQTDGIFDKDPRKVVMDIAIMENGPPEVDPDLAKEGNENAENYTYQKVGPGVMIGMREGGEFQPADGFGWKDADDFRAHGSPAGSGVTRAREARR